MALIKALGSFDPFFLKGYEDFHSDITDKLKWSQEEWANLNQVNSDRYFFCKNIKFWFDRLAEVKDARYLVLTTFSRGSCNRPSFKDIMLAFKRQFGLDGLCGASQAENANYCILFFSSQELKFRVMKEFCIVGESYIVHSGWLPQQPLVQFQLNWLPPDIPLDSIKEELEKFTKITSLTKEPLDLGEGDLLPTGKVVGTLDSNSVSSLQVLPHFLSFPPYKAHWIIYNRPPVCFVCKWVGHLAVKCPTPFCVKCQRLLPRLHQCGKPLAFVDTLNNGLDSTPLKAPSVFDDVVLARKFSSPSHSLEMLTNQQNSVNHQVSDVFSAPFLVPQASSGLSASVEEYSDSSGTDDGSIYSLMLKENSKSSDHEPYFSSKPAKLPIPGLSETSPTKIKQVKLSPVNQASNSQTFWTPPKGTLSFNLSSTASSRKTYARKPSKRK